MTYEYDKVITPGGGLRLHLNENTAGCSPKVLAALQALTCHDVAYYPDYEDAVTSAAARLGVTPPELVLTNGLDEGILAASVCALRSTDRSAEGIVVVPAFDMYAVCIDAMGGRVIDVPLGDDFSFPMEAIAKAIGPQTRIIFLTNPNNPTGQLIPREQILTIARSAPQALVFLDEAYTDFAEASLISDGEARKLKNLVIGRTFAKAYGLAGVRAGAVIGHPETIAPLRQVVPPFSLNVYAATALTAGFADTDYYAWYLDQVRSSKELLYETLDRLGVKYWQSAANFVLIELGDDLRRVIDGLSARQVYIRDRSKDAASPGCVRVTTGVVEHTRAFVAALEEVLCDAA